MSFLNEKIDHFLLHIKAIPNSSKTKLSGFFYDEKNQKYLKVSIAAVPEDGKANDEVIKLFSKLLKIPKSKIEILRGKNSRIKVLKLYKLDNDPRPFLDRELRDLQ